MVEKLNIPYRNILVCSDGYKVIGWRTEAEFQELVGKGKVDWYAIKTGKDLSYYRMPKLEEATNLDVNTD